MCEVCLDGVQDGVRDQWILLEVMLFDVIFSWEYEIFCGQPMAQMDFHLDVSQLGCLDGSRLSK